jgi:single-strand DNA-binding protein
MNSVNLIGRLTIDPSSRIVTTPTGQRTVTTLAVAVPPERGRDGDPCYIDVDVWGPAAEACARYLQKGRQVAVTGRLELQRWTAGDGTARRAHRVVATAVEFLDRPPVRHDDIPEAVAA